jgi:hypothetical protein
MANVYNYNFNNLGRIGNDTCYQDQNTIQNIQSCNYSLQNYFADDCAMKKSIDVATSQPCVNYTGGYNSGAGGCNIDDNSNLLIGTINTHPKCRIDLFQRPFATVPFLGRGSVCSIMESQLQQGEMVTNKRTVTKLSEKSYLKYSNTPLISDIEQQITNPNFCVEEVASNGSWIRGGIPSRELTKDSDYYNQHTKNQYI